MREIHHALRVARDARQRVPADAEERAILVDHAVANVERIQSRAAGFLQRANAAAKHHDATGAEAYARAVERCAREAKAAATEARTAR